MTKKTDPYKEFLDKAHDLATAMNEEAAVHPVVRAVIGDEKADDRDLATKAAGGIVDLLKGLTGTKKLVKEHVEGLMLAIALAMKQGEMFEGLAKLGVERPGHEAMQSFAMATSEMTTALELIREDRKDGDWTPPEPDEKKEEVVDSAEGTGNYL